MSSFTNYSSANKSSRNMFSALDDSDYDSDSKVQRKTFKYIDSKLEKNQMSKNKKTTSKKTSTTSLPVISRTKPNVVISFSKENFPSLPKQKIVSITVSENWNNISEDVKFPPSSLKKQCSSVVPPPEKTMSRLQYCIEKALDKKYVYKKSILHNWADDQYWNSEEEEEDEFEEYNEADFYSNDEDLADF